MEFDKNRVFTSVNADELKPGSKVIVANSFKVLKIRVRTDYNSYILARVCEENYEKRFELTATSHWLLAYLISEPEEKKLKWTDLKMGDIVSNQTETRMVIGINTSGLINIDDECISHVNLGGTWADDEDLAEWEKVEK